MYMYTTQEQKQLLNWSVGYFQNYEKVFQSKYITIDQIECWAFYAVLTAEFTITKLFRKRDCTSLFT